MTLLADIRRALQVVFESVPDIGPVLMYPPKTIPADRTVYLVRDGFEDASAGQVRGRRWNFTARLVVLWQDAETAEAELDRLTENLLAAVDADAHLGGVLRSGLAKITGGDDGWFQTENSASWYRFCDLDIEVLDKG